MEGQFFLFTLCILLNFGLFNLEAYAAERHPDPDGCFSCHSLEGLDYIDEEGVLRSASIDKQHYYSSLHGSVPCKDCHRKIQNYPHKVENGEVDCSESCHVEEPSQGEPYSHQYVVEEYKSSVHGKGWSKGLTGGNRLEEANHEQDPSCRQCHSNDLYIDADKLPLFMESFDHLDGECGSCHQGEVWLGQFGGHILRRFMGSRWNKNDHNKMCNTCHANHKRMADVERDIPNKDKKIKEKAEPRFILASDSYTTTLHARLLVTDVMEGASCLDCHAPKGFRHGILPDEDKEASTHSDHLAETCAQSNCHAYATHPLNRPFVETDLHDMDMIPSSSNIASWDWSRLKSTWVKVFIILLPILLFLGAASIWSRFFGEKKKGVVFSEIGGDSFQEKIIGRKPKKKAKKKAPVKKAPVKKEPVKKEPVKEEPIKEEPIKEEPAKSVQKEKPKPAPEKKPPTARPEPTSSDIKKKEGEDEK